jgi:hypothetical protein
MAWLRFLSPGTVWRHDDISGTEWAGDSEDVKENAQPKLRIFHALGLYIF